MKRFITESAIALRLVWFRVFCYFALPAWLMFDEITEGMDGAHWSAMTEFDRVKVYGKCVSAGVMALVAFIDSAMAKAKNDVAEERKAQTDKIKLD